MRYSPAAVTLSCGYALKEGKLILLSGSCADQTDCVCVPCSCAFTCSTDGTVTSMCTRCRLVIMHMVVGCREGKPKGGGRGGGAGCPSCGDIEQ